MEDEEGWQPARRRPSTKATNGAQSQSSQSQPQSQPQSGSKPKSNPTKQNQNPAPKSNPSSSSASAPAGAPNAPNTPSGPNAHHPHANSSKAHHQHGHSNSSTATNWRSSSSSPAPAPAPSSSPVLAPSNAPSASTSNPAQPKIQTGPHQDGHGHGKDHKIDLKVGKVLHFTSSTAQEDLVVVKIDESYCYFGNQNGSLRVKYNPETKILTTDFEVKPSQTILLPQDVLYGSGVLLHDSSKGVVLLGETWTHSYVDFCYRIRYQKYHSMGKHVFPIHLFSQLLSATRFDLMTNQELEKLLGLKEEFLSSLSFVTEELKMNRLSPEEFQLLERLVNREKGHRKDLSEANLSQALHTFSIPKGNYLNPHLSTKATFPKNSRENAIQELIKALNLNGKSQAVVDNASELTEKALSIGENPSFSAPYVELLGVALGDLQVFVLDVDSDKFKVVKTSHWDFKFQWESYEEAKKKMEPLHYAKFAQYLQNKPQQNGDSTLKTESS